MEQQILSLYKQLPMQQEYFWLYRKQKQEKRLQKNRAEKLRAKQKQLKDNSSNNIIYE